MFSIVLVWAFNSDCDNNAKTIIIKATVIEFFIVHYSFDDSYGYYLLSHHSLKARFSLLLPSQQNFSDYTEAIQNSSFKVVVYRALL